jgi:peptidoglycan/LPS O-acetylase OafA/YrhL
MNKSKRLLPALTGMRFFLSLWVVAYHQEASLDGFFQPASAPLAALSSFLQTGYSAVSAFFILSGFVLSYNYDLGTLRTGCGLRRFAAARFSRIYPAYLAGILILLPLAAYRLYAGLPIDSTGGLFSLVLNVLLLQSWLPWTALTWNFPGWSLSDEAFFYALLPFIGAFVYRLGQKASGTDTPFPGFRWGIAFLCMWGCSMALPFYAVVAHIHGFGDVPGTASNFEGAAFWPGLVRYNPVLRLPEFCMGILLARLYRGIPSEHWLRNRGGWLYLSGLAVALLVLTNGHRIPYPPLHNGLLAPAYAAVILGLALGGGALVRLLSAPAVVFLGNASYSMYILHAPIYTWLKLFFKWVLVLPADGWVWFVCYLIAVCIAASVFYRLVEEPLHQWLRRRLNQTSSVAR